MGLCLTYMLNCLIELGAPFNKTVSDQIYLSGVLVIWGGPIQLISTPPIHLQEDSGFLSETWNR